MSIQRHSLPTSCRVNEYASKMKLVGLQQDQYERIVQEMMEAK